MRSDIIINSLTQLRLHFPFNEEKIVVNRKENAMSYSLPSVLFTFFKKITGRKYLAANFGIKLPLFKIRGERSSREIINENIVMCHA